MPVSGELWTLFVYKTIGYKEIAAGISMRDSINCDLIIGEHAPRGDSYF